MSILLFGQYAVPDDVLALPLHSADARSVVIALLQKT
jgi:hypothetical protein